jgi:hypothetical protein
VTRFAVPQVGWWQVTWVGAPAGLGWPSPRINTTSRLLTQVIWDSEPIEHDDGPAGVPARKG